MTKQIAKLWEQRKFIVIHSFSSGMHHYECIALNVDIDFQSGESGNL